VLNQTITAVGASNTIDTNGYGAIVAQISGVWQGNCYFEASNDGTVWNTILTFSRDNLSLQDSITSGGLYTVRPSGRYLRLMVTNIAGDLSINAIGRAAEGIAASDVLSLAMDKQNNTPLNVQLNGVKQATDGAIVLDDCGGPYYLTGASNSLILDTKGYSWVSITTAPTGAASASAQVVFSNELGNLLPPTGGFGIWALGVCYSVGGTGTVGMTMSNAHPMGNTTLAVGTAWPVLGRYAQVRLNSFATTGTAVIVLRSTPFSVPLPAVTATLAASTILVGDVGTQYRAFNNTGTASVFKFTAAASTNAALVGTSLRRLIGWTLTNTTATVKYFRFYNKATAPTVGTDSPYFVIPIPANSTVTERTEGGIFISLGLGISCTGAIADLDATATAGNDVIGAIFYV
jgi:hypothetical protein